MVHVGQKSGDIRLATTSTTDLTQVDILNAELTAADPSLVDNAALLAAVFLGSGDCIKILDLDGRLQFMSEGGKRVMEVDDFSQLKGCPWPDLWKDEGNLAARQAIATARSGIPAHFVGGADTVKGNPKYWDVQVLPIIGANGRPTHLLSISRDITGTRAATETIGRLIEEARAVITAEAESMRRLLKNAPSFMCVLRGPDHVYEMTNDAYLQLIGHRPVIGMPVRGALPEVDGQGFYELLDRVYATGEPFVGRGVEIDLQVEPNAPLQKAYLNFVYQPTRGEDGSVTGIFVEGSDITDQMRAELALRDSQIQVQLALAAAEMGVWESTMTGGTFRNLQGDDRALTLLGGKPGEKSSFDMFVSRVHPEDRAILIPAAQRALDPAGDGLMNVEYRVLATGADPERWVQALAQAIPEGDKVRLVGTVRDITDRKEAEAHQGMLSGELQHRIKNIIAMVSAIATQTLKGDDIADRRGKFGARLEALSHAHDMLVATAWSAASIRTVVDGALVAHKGDHDTFEIVGPDLVLSPRQALSLALTVHELATNATKYGALSVDEGRVRIEWSIESGGEGGGSLFTFIWREIGGPTVIEPERTGFGSRLITRVLAADFSGSVTIDYASAGVVCRLEAPAAEISAS